MAQAVITNPSFLPLGRATYPVPGSPAPTRQTAPLGVRSPAPDTLLLRRLRKWNVCLSLAIVYTALSLGHQLYQGSRLYRHAQVLEREWRQEKAEQQQALQALARANHPEELERLARERLGFVRPDEIAVKLVAR